MVKGKRGGRIFGENTEAKKKRTWWTQRGGGGVKNANTQDKKLKEPTKNEPHSI